jgi:hypothetical protein
MTDPGKIVNSKLAIHKKTGLNVEMDTNLRRMPYMNPYMKNTIHNLFSALIANVEIEWPANCDPGPMAQRAMLLDIYTQLCTHGVVGGVLNIAKNQNPMRRQIHAPLFSGTNRFVGQFHLAQMNEIQWTPDTEDNDFLRNIAVFVYRLPYQDIVPETFETQWIFDGWLSLYLDIEIQMRSMSNSAFRSFIRSSEGFLRRRLDIPEMLKGMPESKMAKEVETYLAETQDIRGAVALPHEYRAQVSFAKTAAQEHAPNTPGWPHDRVLPPGMTEDIVMPSQISTGILSDMRSELYNGIIEMQHHAASTIRSVVEAAILYFYNVFFRPDCYAYFLMLEARRQVESICQFVEHKIEFSEVEYWLILPTVEHNAEALLTAIHASVSSESEDGNASDSMNPYLRQITVQSYNATKGQKVVKSVKRPRSVRLLRREEKEEECDIRASRVLRNALAPFIVDPPKHPHTAGVVPTFNWPPVKNILPDDEKDKSNGRKRSTSTTSVVH